MTPRAFVTGIGGQDGSYLAERLVADSLEVHALVLDADGPPPYCPEEVVLHAGDIGDIAATRRLVLEIAPAVDIPGHGPAGRLLGAVANQVISKID